MNIIQLLKFIILFYKQCIEKLYFASSWKLIVSIFLTFLVVILLAFRSLADIPSAARVINFNGSGSDFWIRQEARVRDTIAVKKGVEMKAGGSLSVPSEDDWASFGFVTQDQSYNGLIVKTYDKGTYTFPCQIRGHFIIAWSGEGSRNRACSAGEDGIQIEHFSSESLSSSSKSVETISSADKVNNNEISDRQGDDNLAVAPAEGQTVLRTSSDISLSYDYTDYSDSRFWPDIHDLECGTRNSPESAQTCRWRCTTQGPPSESIRTCVWNSSSTNDGNVDSPHNHKYECIVQDTAQSTPITPVIWTCTEIPIAITVEAVSIEAFKGDILVKSKQNPEGTQVKEGQKFSYPGGKIESINVKEEANSCEMLKFLNAAYWSSPETPKSVSDSIADQLKQHRQALGVSGRYPTNLSVLEQRLIAEINLARNNPHAYADSLEEKRQYFYRNPLNLRGETFDSDRRANAVNEAINFVRSKQSLPGLSVSLGMSNASRDHVNDQGKSGKNFGHTSSNRNGYSDRLRKYGSVGCNDGESISYFDSSKAQGSVSPERLAVMEALIVDDGLRRAGDRDNFFNPDFQVMGVACGQHRYLHSMCVITYAEGFIEKI